MHNSNIQVYTFNDLNGDWISEELVKRVSSIYESVDDIDLLVGVLSEKPKPGSVFGQTLTCIIGNQFYKVRLLDEIRLSSFCRQADRIGFGMR